MRSIPPDLTVRIGRDVLREDVVGQLEALTGIGVWTWSQAVSQAAWSEQFLRLLGMDPGSPQGTVEDFYALVHPADLAMVQDALRNRLPIAGHFEIDHRIILPDGRIRWLHNRARAEVVDARVQFAIGVIQDITDARGAARELARARDLFDGVFRSVAEPAIVGLDGQGVITVFNSGAERMLGYRAAEMVGTSRLLDLYDDAEVRASAVQGYGAVDLGSILGRAADGQVEARDWTLVCRDGTRRPVVTSVTTVRGADDAPAGYLICAMDRAAREAGDSLPILDLLFEEVFDNAGTAIMLIELEGSSAGRIFRVNPALGRITGYSDEQLLSMTVGELAHPDERPLLAAVTTEIAGDSQALHGERHWVHADGRDVWVQMTVTKVAHGASRFLVYLAEDVTGRKEAERRLSFMALHDVLTGLPNRSQLDERIEVALDGASRTGRCVALIYLDLDGFKAVNDQAGHLAGDDILVMVARRLTGSVPPGATVSRIGGDEFVVLVPDLEPATDPRPLAELLLRATCENYPWHGRAFTLTASVGVALAREPVAARELLRAADDAMYAAKAAGKSRVFVSGEVGTVLSVSAAQQIRLEEELRLALAADQFVLFAQPIVDLAAPAEVSGIEMLIRWRHPIRGLLPPSEFLFAAENGPFIHRLSRWILREACAIGTALAVVAPSHRLDVFVNVSGRHLESGRFARDVNEALARSGFPPEHLVLEVTETSTALISGAVRHDINTLRRQGVRIAIDDLGTGYSSLARLTELPVDILKIDRAFVARLADPTVTAVVQAIIGMAGSLRLQVGGEGVETADQETRLRALGCALAQGFRFSPPQPPAELLTRFG